MKKSEHSLALFFTRGLSLKDWIETGLLAREKLIYEKHLEQKNFQAVYWVTYGEQNTEENLARAQQLNIKILGKPKAFLYLPDFIYWFFLPFIHFKFLKNCSVFKSNQLDGAWNAWWASLVLGKKFYLRTGYTLSLFLPDSRKKSIVKFIEKWLYRLCDAFSVSSLEDYEYVIKYKPRSNGIILRNFIDLNLFKPGSGPDSVSFVSVCRFNAQKNLFNLIEAFKTLPYSLTLIGEGELRKDIELVLKEQKISNVILSSRVSNKELATILSTYSHFILTSLFEGNPKALLEAMSLGMICVGTNVSGIREILRDNENGFIAADTSSDEIKKTVIRSIEGSQKIREAARNYICEYHNIDVIVSQERDLLYSLFK